MEEDDVEDLEDVSEDDEQGSAATARPYMALIKSLTEDSNAPNAKRRKLGHQTAATEQPQDRTAGPEQDQVEDVDFVEEPEEDPEEADAEDTFDGNEDDEEEKVDLSDPFQSHFAAIDEAIVTRRLKAIEEAKWSTKKVVSKGSKVILNAPDTGNESDLISVPALISGPADLPLKHRLQESMAGKRPNFDAVEQSLAPYIFGYQDLYFCNRTLGNSKSLRRLACLHALNHVLKSVTFYPSILCSV